MAWQLLLFTDYLQTCLLQARFLEKKPLSSLALFRELTSGLVVR